MQMAGDVENHYKMKKLEQTQCSIKNLTRNRTKISRNRNVALCGCGNQVLVFGLTTGKLIQKFESHQSRVTDFYFRKTDSLQVISASEDGNILIWDYSDGSVIKALSLRHPICRMLANPKKEDVFFVTKKERTSGKCALIEVDLNKSKKKKLSGEMIGTVRPEQKHIAINSQGDYIVSLNGDSIKIFSLADKSCKRYSYDGRVFTCVAFHPSKFMIATGDSEGKIVLWQNFTSSKDTVTTDPVTTELHWHAHPVADLSFTHDGSYLLSGGLEATLVTWQLETLTKDFTPRLGSPIQHLSVSEDDALAVISLSNNVVKIISMVDKSLVRTLRGLSQGLSAAGMKYDPRTNHLILPAFPPGHLQFFDPERDSVSMILDVVGQNYLTGVSSESVFSTEIQHFDVSYDGNWLATVEKGCFDIIPDEVKLKFWYFDVEEQKFYQNTVADPPHEDEITDLKIRPKPESSVFKHLAVTCDVVGKFKIWTLENTENEGDEEQLTWSCHAVCYYGNGPCGKVTFSEDGSLLALVYGKNITVWDSEIGEMKTCLTSPVRNEKISDVVFGCATSAAYMLTRTTNYLICWNLLTCSVWWSLETKATCIAADPFSGLFAVFVSPSEDKSRLYYFDATNPRPVRKVRNALSNEEVTSAAFIDFNSKYRIESDEDGVTNLYFYTDQKNIYKVSQGKAEGLSAPDEEVTEEAVQSEFEKIFGFSTGNEEDKDSKKEQPKSTSSMQSADVVRKILATPSHVLPSATVLCSAFFNSMSLQSHSNARYIETEEGDKEQEESDSESDGSDEDDIETNRKQIETKIEIYTELQSTLTSTENIAPTFDWISSFVEENYKK